MSKPWLFFTLLSLVSCNGEGSSSADAGPRDAGVITQVCRWNDLTGKFDKDCVASTGEAGSERCFACPGTALRDPGDFSGCTFIPCESKPDAR